jgi:predicted dehydrogenase
MSPQPVLRIGVIGTARVVAYGLVQPAQGMSDVKVEAIASRSLERAESFASTLGIRRSFGSYQAMLDDPEIDAVYVALPTALHAEWVRGALEAGKHVLCEKPLAANAEVAQDLVTCAAEHQRVLLEGLHVRYLRKLQRQRELVVGGEFGRPLRVESCFRVPNIPMAEGDFRLRFELGGGAGLDLGCYAVSCLRYVAGGEPEVESVRCRRAASQVDRWMRAVCRLPSGSEGVVECGFRGWYSLRLGVEVSCERGWVKWEKGGLVHSQGGRTVHEAIPDDWTYRRQLQAFADRIRGRPSDAPPPGDAVANARVLDAMYAAAGLAPRPTAVPA